jgi:hypothetical protein
VERSNRVSLYRSDTVVVEYREEANPGDRYAVPVYTVKVRGKRARTFRGECAWSDAERYASDHDRAAAGCTL